MRDLDWKTTLLIDRKAISTGVFFHSIFDDFCYLHTRNLETLWDSGIGVLSTGCIAPMLKCCMTWTSEGDEIDSSCDAAQRAQAALGEYLKEKLAASGWQPNWSSYSID